MRPDVGLLIVTHENLAVELVRATGKIVGAVLVQSASESH